MKAAARLRPILLSSWFYRYIAGVGSGIEIEFVDPTGSGEYRIARNPDEKDALLHIPGAGLTLAESMGLADKADRIIGLRRHRHGQLSTRAGQSVFAPATVG